MPFSRISFLFVFTYIANAKQPSAPNPLPAPLRELPWGQLNFLHTTDTHGWHAGHLQEPQYAADWGDYVSFAHHLHRRADADGSDLLLIDTGDRIEGNGLYDASDPTGKYLFDIVKQQSIDVVTIGNHELYQKNSSDREYDEVVPDFKDSYIASNVDIYHPKTGELVALARRYRKFTTKNQGVRILAFGFLFNFRGNANNTRIQNVKETIKEEWFQDAIREKDVDLFLVAGHVALRNSPEFEQIYKAIREAQWDIPIVFFGGHFHIRDYRKYEKKAYGIASGRYMETVGFLSISGLSTGEKSSVHPEATPKYERLYIDNNLFSLHHHSGTSSSTFDTELGLNVSKSISAARETLNLDHAYGCAPKTYWLNRAPFPSDNSLLTLMEDEVLPDTFADLKTPSIVLTNTGAIRFDIFEGPFTIDSTFLVSPFISGFRRLKDVPYEAASKILDLLNNQGQIPLHDLKSIAERPDGEDKLQLEDLIPARVPVNERSLEFGKTMNQFAPHLIVDSQQQTFLGDDDDDDREKPQVPGYTTVDDAGTDGDDTLHQPLEFFTVPNCIGTNIGFSKSFDLPEKVDVIYNEFIQDWVILALQFLGEKRDRDGDTSPALDGKTMTDVISEWIQVNWPCEQ